MRIHSISRIIAMPFLIVGGVILYYLFFKDMESWYPYLIPIAVIVAGIYALSPRIDFWWHKKHAPLLPDPVVKLVYNGSKFYQDLDESMRQKFLDRLSLFMHHKAFYLMRKEKEAMPEDIKALIGVCATTLGMNSDKYFFEKYDYFIAYQHPFPTPIKQNLHSVEINHEDGVMIFNADLLFQAMILNNGAFNVGLYAFAEAFLVMEPLSDLAQAEEPDPKKMPESGRYMMKNIIHLIGYEDVYFKAVLITIYFEEPAFLAERYPELYQLCLQQFSNPDKPLP